jgi:hypothetical protein
MSDTVVITDHIVRWVAEEREEPPTVAILRLNPGNVAVIDEVTLNEYDIYYPRTDRVYLCQGYPRIKTWHHQIPLDGGEVRHEIRARWIPDGEWEEQQAGAKRAAALKELTKMLREALKP